jgi:hypothetical protein
VGRKIRYSVFAALALAIVPFVASCGASPTVLGGPLDGDWAVFIGPPGTQNGACMAIRQSLVTAWSKGCSAFLSIENTSRVDGRPLVVSVLGSQVTIEVYVLGFGSGVINDALLTFRGVLLTDGSVVGTLEVVGNLGFDTETFEMRRL